MVAGLELAIAGLELATVAVELVFVGVELAFTGPLTVPKEIYPVQYIHSL